MKKILFIIALSYLIFSKGVAQSAITELQLVGLGDAKNAPGEFKLTAWVSANTRFKDRYNGLCTFALVTKGGGELVSGMFWRTPDGHSWYREVGAYGGIEYAGTKVGPRVASYFYGKLTPTVNEARNVSIYGFVEYGTVTKYWYLLQIMKNTENLSYGLHAQFGQVIGPRISFNITPIISFSLNAGVNIESPHHNQPAIFSGLRISL